MIREKCIQSSSCTTTFIKRVNITLYKKESFGLSFFIRILFYFIYLLYLFTNKVFSYQERIIIGFLLLFECVFSF